MCINNFAHLHHEEWGGGDLGGALPPNILGIKGAEPSLIFGLVLLLYRLSKLYNIATCRADYE